MIAYPWASLSASAMRISRSASGRGRNDAGGRWLSIVDVSIDDIIGRETALSRDFVRDTLVRVMAASSSAAARATVPERVPRRQHGAEPEASCVRRNAWREQARVDPPTLVKRFLEQ